MPLKAVRRDGSVVREGDQIIDFRGDVWTYTGCAASGGTGRVFVHIKGKKYGGAFFPSVFNLAVKEVPDA